MKDSVKKVILKVEREVNERAKTMGEMTTAEEHRAKFMAALDDLCRVGEIKRDTYSVQQVRIHAHAWAGEEYRQGVNDQRANVPSIPKVEVEEGKCGYPGCLMMTAAGSAVHRCNVAGFGGWRDELTVCLFEPHGKNPNCHPFVGSPSPSTVDDGWHCPPCRRGIHESHDEEDGFCWATLKTDAEPIDCECGWREAAPATSPSESSKDQTRDLLMPSPSSASACRAIHPEHLNVWCAMPFDHVARGQSHIGNGYEWPSSQQTSEPTCGAVNGGANDHTLRCESDRRSLAEARELIAEMLRVGVDGWNASKHLDVVARMRKFVAPVESPSEQKAEERCGYVWNERGDTCKARRDQHFPESKHQFVAVESPVTNRGLGAAGDSSPDVRSTSSTDLVPPESGIECEACGDGNSLARSVCGKCGEPLLHARMSALIGDLSTSAHEIRRNDDGTIDEVVAKNLRSAHLEQMDEGAWWLGLYLHDGTTLRIDLVGDEPETRKVVVQVEVEEPECVGGLATAEVRSLPTTGQISRDAVTASERGNDAAPPTQKQADQPCENRYECFHSPRCRPASPQPPVCVRSFGCVLGRDHTGDCVAASPCPEDVGCAEYVKRLESELASEKAKADEKITHMRATIRSLQSQSNMLESDLAKERQRNAELTAERDLAMKEHDTLRAEIARLRGEG